MEFLVGNFVMTWQAVDPHLPQKEKLVLWFKVIFRFFPWAANHQAYNLTNRVEKEAFFWYKYGSIRDFEAQTEALLTGEVQLFRDDLVQIFDSSRGVNLKKRKEQGCVLLKLSFLKLTSKAVSVPSGK